jgi:uncharacterized protein DUF4265
MNREKIVVDLPPGMGTGTTAETLWGKEVGPNEYELENIPVWAYGLAFGDVVAANVADDGRRHFEKLLRKSGLLTVRAAGPDADRQTFSELCDMLQHRAVATERFSSSYVAFAMEPPDFSAVEPAIDDAERSGAIYVEIANDDS